MFRIACISFLLILIFPLTTAAQIYKYKDANGNIIYTNDITRVPRDQQPKVRKYQEYQAPDTGGVTDKAEEAVEPKAKKTESAAKAESTSAADSQKADEFEKRKIELDREYQELLKEKRALDKIRPTLREGRKEAAASYNKRVSALNDRIEAYEKKKEAFNAEVESYNAKVRQEIEAMLEKNMQEKK